MAEQWLMGAGDSRVSAAVSRTGSTVRRWTAEANRAADGLWVDLGLYVLSAVFAALTIRSSLAPHREWGAIAAVGYGIAAGAVLVQLVRWSVYQQAPVAARAVTTVVAWVATAIVPLVVEAVQRAQGQPGRAQEEVVVIEEGGRRLLETGTPYLDRVDIAALPDQLLGYLPYQPGMAAFGIPRALGQGWWTDARIWFAIVTAAALATAMIILKRAGIAPPALIRALQAATVLPVCALSLATGGDDLPVLALCLLAFALAATGRLTLAGIAIGVAAGLKLFAWPVLLILGVHAWTQRRLTRYAITAIAVPVALTVPAFVLNPAALVENVVAFPLGRGLVTSPAASPLPGHLIATMAPGGRIIAEVLLAAAAILVVMSLVRHPPRTASAAARITGWSLLAAMLLLPATRFGYLLYPVAFLVWAPALRPRPIPAPRAAPTVVPATA